MVPSIQVQIPCKVRHGNVGGCGAIATQIRTEELITSTHILPRANRISKAQRYSIFTNMTIKWANVALELWSEEGSICIDTRRKCRLRMHMLYTIDRLTGQMSTPCRAWSSPPISCTRFCTSPSDSRGKIRPYPRVSSVIRSGDPDHALSAALRH